MSKNKIPPMIKLTINVFSDGSVMVDIDRRDNIPDDVTSRVLLKAMYGSIDGIKAIGEVPSKPFAEA